MHTQEQALETQLVAFNDNKNDHDNFGHQEKERGELKRKVYKGNPLALRMQTLAKQHVTCGRSIHSRLGKGVNGAKVRNSTFLTYIFLFFLISFLLIYIIHAYKSISN